MAKRIYLTCNATIEGVARHKGESLVFSDAETDAAIANGIAELDTTVGAGLGAATLANIASSASNVTLLAANTARKRVIIVNDSSSILYIKFGAMASATSYSIRLYPNETYESPPFQVWIGQIDGVWSSASGAARITEM